MAERFYEKETGNQVHAWQVPDGDKFQFVDPWFDEVHTAHAGEWVVDYGSKEDVYEVVDDESFREDYERCGR